jgi:hypothetical protein
MAAHGDSKTKSDLKGDSGSGSAAAAAPSVQGRPWRETVASRTRSSAVKRRSNALDVKEILNPSSSGSAAAASPVRKKVRATSASEIKLSAVAKALAASALGIKGIRQTIIRQALLARGGECVLVTGDGRRCDRATQYIRDKGVEGKERSINCAAYCRENCRAWARGVIANPPTGVTVFLDGMELGAIPLDMVVIRAHDRRAMLHTPNGWINPNAERNRLEYTIDQAVEAFCDMVKAGYIRMLIEIPIITFKPLGPAAASVIARTSSVPARPPTAIEWKEMINGGRVTFRFRGVAHSDGTWISPWNRWKITSLLRGEFFAEGLDALTDTVVLTTIFPSPNAQF